MSKRKITVSLSSDLIDWIDRQVEERAEYRNRSHLIELALVRFKDQVSASRRASSS